MLSIIICSRKENVSDELAINIDKTIGCAYELIVIDNSANKYSIFEAYNLGIEKSKGIYLCFIHDDILFHTQNWGEVINRVFNENPKAGLLGIAGTKMKTKMPSAWWRCPEDKKAIKIIQHSKHPPSVNWDLGFKNNSLEQVVVIDGVFMVLRKDKNLHFNKEIKGFHNYDLNISFECIKKGFTIFVTDEILTEHFSAGSINKDWVVSTFKIHRMYKDLLPLFLPKETLNKKMETANAKRFIKDCFKHKKRGLAFSTWIRLFNLDPLSKYSIKFFVLFIKSF